MVGVGRIGDAVESFCVIEKLDVGIEVRMEQSFSGNYRDLTAISAAPRIRAKIKDWRLQFSSAEKIK